MKKTEQHINLLLETLRAANKLTVSEAQELLGVSESTARRLFGLMEHRGYAIRLHGGVRPIVQNRDEYSFDVVENRNIIQKKKIGSRAAELVQSDDIIFLDSGSTLAFMSDALAEKINQNRIKNIRVFTNSLAVFSRLKTLADVTLIGGRYRDNRKDFCGYLAEEALKTLSFSKCFLGADGYNPTSGFAANDFSTARMSEIVLKRSLIRVLLADETKFTTSAMVSFTDKNKINLLITDSQKHEDILQKLRADEVGIIISQ